jgi:hypothetical protein
MKMRRCPTLSSFGHSPFWFDSGFWFRHSGLSAGVSSF